MPPGVRRAAHILLHQVPDSQPEYRWSRVATSARLALFFGESLFPEPLMSPSATAQDTPSCAKPLIFPASE